MLGKCNADIMAVLLHGLRVSEICGLELADVILMPRRGLVIVRSGKGGVYREVPLNKDARQALQTWLEARPENGSSLLFTSRSDGPVQPRDIQRMLDKLAHSASGLEPEEVTPHKLRHSFGKSLVDAGVSLDRVAMLMGHQDLATTAIYTTPSRADLTAAVEKIAWQENFHDLPASRRECRHAINGEVAGRSCHNGFDCRACGFDAALTPVDAAVPAEAAPLGFDLPADRMYHRGHTWVKPQDDGTLVVGLDDFGARLVGEPDGVDLPSLGSRVEVNGTGWHMAKQGGRVRVLSPVDNLLEAHTLLA